MVPVLDVVVLGLASVRVMDSDSDSGCDGSGRYRHRLQVSSPFNGCLALYDHHGSRIWNHAFLCLSLAPPLIFRFAATHHNAVETDVGWYGGNIGSGAPVTARPRALIYLLYPSPVIVCFRALVTLSSQGPCLIVD